MKRSQLAAYVILRKSAYPSGLRQSIKNVFATPGHTLEMPLLGLWSSVDGSCLPLHNRSCWSLVRKILLPVEGQPAPRTTLARSVVAYILLCKFSR